MVGYVAKDEDDSLFLYTELPKYDYVNKMWLGGEYIQITEQSILDKFAYLKYNYAPVPVEIKLEILK